MKGTLIAFCILSIVLADEINKVDRNVYFSCEFLTPRKCQIETEEGIKAFWKSNFPN